MSQTCLVRSTPWKAGQIKCHHLTLYINRIGGYSPCIQTLWLSSESPTFSYNHSLHILSAICLRYGQRRRVLPRLKVVWPGQGRHRFKIVFRFDKGENGIPPSFSQNPKQVLVASDSWCVRSKVFRHQHRLLYRRHGYVKAHQLPAPCTFSSTVLASS